MGRNLTERTTRRARLRRTGTLIVAGLSLLLLTGCSQETTDQLKRLGLPEPASDRSPYMKELWVGAWIAAAIVGVFVWGLILWASFRYRQRPGSEPPTQIRYNLPIEVLYTIAPLIVVAVLFFFTVQEQDRITADVKHPDHEVVVTAQRWSWTFSYLNEPAAGAKDVYDQGTADALPELWLVKDETVNFDLHSPDVIHSFWVPSFYFKLDVIPGHDQGFSITPTTIGTFAGRCAELCGYLHSRMIFEVHVVDRPTFDQHVKGLEAAGQIGTPKGQSNSETVSGLDTSEGGAQ